MKNAWVLRLKDESKESDMVGDHYFVADGDDWTTDDLQKATIYQDKNQEIEAMKEHEKIIIDRYGKNSVINFGYTNMMKHFEFFEVEVEEIN